MSPWRRLGTDPPASRSRGAAGPGSSRVYYEHRETGEYCYRFAGWSTHGTGVHGFDVFSNAMGQGCDAWGRENGRIYPASEF